MNTQNHRNLSHLFYLRSTSPNRRPATGRGLPARRTLTEAPKLGCMNADQSLKRPPKRAKKCQAITPLNPETRLHTKDSDF